MAKRQKRRAGIWQSGKKITVSVRKTVFCWWTGRDLHPSLTCFVWAFYILIPPIILALSAGERAPFGADLLILSADAGPRTCRSYPFKLRHIPASGIQGATLRCQAAQARLALLKEGKATTLELLEFASKFKFPFLQRRAFGMLFPFSARNRICNSPAKNSCVAVSVLCLSGKMSGMCPACARHVPGMIPGMFPRRIPGALSGRCCNTLCLAPGILPRLVPGALSGGSLASFLECAYYIFVAPKKQAVESNFIDFYAQKH